MKINISRQSIYLLVISIFLLIFVLVFSFSVLIPSGQEYREQRTDIKKENIDLRRYQDFHYDTLQRLRELQEKNRHIITAFDTSFNKERFEKKYKGHFSSLTLHEKSLSDDTGDFMVYEVNTASNISSPKSFYNFLEAINKSDWIVGVNFPINFKREGEVIRSSFTMKVYVNKKESDKKKSTQVPVSSSSNS